RLHLVAGDGDDALNIIDLRIAGVAEDDDVAALRRSPFGHLEVGEGKLEIVGQLKGQEAVADLDRRLHRGGWNMVRRGDRRAQREDRDDQDAEGLDVVEAEKSWLIACRTHSLRRLAKFTRGA